VLDVPCGTGKYWELVLKSGHAIIGVDQSIGMLAVAGPKHPDVPVVCASLQNLPLTGTFDAVMCVDGIEDVGPEDWPTVLSRLHRSTRPGGCLYLTVEQLGESEVRRSYEAARNRGDPVTPGEDFDGIGYHFFPTAAAIRSWVLEAGFDVLDEAVADFYRHLILRRRGG
jgi:SAM-dependent methyltransferase